MLSDRIGQPAHRVELTDGSTGLLPNPPRSHTHLQQVAGCLQVDHGGGPGC